MPTGFRCRLRDLADRFITHEAQYVVITPIAAHGPLVHDPLDDQRSDCLVLESVAQFDAVVANIPASFAPEKLRHRVAAGCVVIVLRQPAGEGADAGSDRRIVGMRLCELGVFSALGLRETTAPDLLFVHHTEVLPELRGRRIALTLRECSLRYGRQLGCRATLSVITTGNAASMAAHFRAKSGVEPRIVATIRRLSFLGGRRVWTTPWGALRSAIEQRGTSR